MPLRAYPGINLNIVRDPRVRAELRAIDTFLRDLSRNLAPSASTTAQGGLPAEPYVTVGNSSNLSSERAIAGSPPATVTDNGANSTVSIGVSDATTTSTGAVRLANQLGGTGQNPTVTGITETGGPTALSIGAIADGQNLQRSGTTVIGVAPGGGGTQATHLKGFVATGDTLTVPTQNQIHLCEEYQVQGTGELILQGTAQLCIEDIGE